MAQCTSCSKVLQGGWNVTEAGEHYKKTGRYLGITDGYFLYSEQPDWVYCYCKACWQNNVLALSFVQAAIQKAATDPLQQIIQGASSVQGWNQFCQNISQQINTAFTNGQNQTTQLLSNAIAQSQQITKTKISELLNQQNQEIQLILQNGIQQQFTNQQTNSLLSDFIEKTITKIYQADQEIIQKEIEKQLNSINKIQCEKIIEFLSQAGKQTVSSQLTCANPLQSEAFNGIIKEQNVTGQQTLKYQYEKRICPLIQTLSKTILESQTICQIYQSDNGKSTSIIQGIWQELEIILLEKISSSLIKVEEQLQQNYNTAQNQVELIIKARDQFLGYLKSIGVQDYVDYEGHIKIFEQDIKKYYKEDLSNLLNALKELQQSVKN